MKYDSYAIKDHLNHYAQVVRECCADEDILGEPADEFELVMREAARHISKLHDALDDVVFGNHSICSHCVQRNDCSDRDNFEGNRFYCFECDETQS